MKKFLVAVVLCLVMVAPCFAGLLDNLPGLKQGILYNWQDSEIEYLSTIGVLDYKNVSLEIGYSSESALVGVVSYPLLKLKELGVNVPILDLIEFNIGLGAGVQRIGSGEGNNEFIYGLTLTLIDIKF